MKKLIPMILAGTMAFSMGTAALAEIEIAQFPQEAVVYKEAVDMANPLKTIFSGAYRLPLTVGEDEARSVLVYLAEAYQQTQGFVMIVPDSGMTAEQCLEEGGWKSVADANGLYLMVLEPKDGKIEAEDGFAYIAAATTLADSREFWRQPEGRNYMVAYGDSVDLALQFTESFLPSTWAGLATFGDLSSTAADIRNAHGTELPVWMFMTAKDQEAEIIDVLKGFNGCTDEAYANAYADEIYFPNQQVNDMLLNDQPMSQVRVTVTQDAAALHADRAAVVYDFLKRGTREVGYGDKAMRYTHNIADWGATVETVEVDGITRSWVQYVPSGLRETAQGKAPLLVAIHGNALNGEYFAERTGYIKLAEEFGFIIVFPTGSINTGIAPTWNLNRAEDQWDDVAFLKTMIETVSANQPVDTSRIYCYGHSMGGMTTQALVSYLDGVFAAACGTGCVNKMVPKVEHQYETPMFVIMGENDLFGTQFADDNVQYFVDYFTAYNKTAQEYDAYRMGRFENYVWENADGVPMVRFTIAGDMPHTATLDEGILMFEYLSQFSRGADGSVVYGGGIHDAH